MVTSSHTSHDNPKETRKKTTRNDSDQNCGGPDAKIQISSSHGVSNWQFLKTPAEATRGENQVEYIYVQNLDDAAMRQRRNEEKN
jgi:hypothetical protein